MIYPSQLTSTTAATAAPPLSTGIFVDQQLRHTNASAWLDEATAPLQQQSQQSPLRVSPASQASQVVARGSPTAALPGSWYYVDAAGTENGPVSSAAIALFFEEGVLHLDSALWRQGMPDWSPLQLCPTFALNPNPEPLTSDSPTANANFDDLWFYAIVGSKEGEQEGPVNRATLLEWVDSGELAPDTLVWTPSMDLWAPLFSIEMLERPLVVMPPLMTTQTQLAQTPTSPGGEALWHFEDAEGGVRGTANHKAMVGMLRRGTLSNSALLWNPASGQWRSVADEPSLAGAFIEGQLQSRDLSSSLSRSAVSPSTTRAALRSSPRRNFRDGPSLQRWHPQVENRLALEDPDFEYAASGTYSGSHHPSVSTEPDVDYIWEPSRNSLRRSPRLSPRISAAARGTSPRRSPPRAESNVRLGNRRIVASVMSNSVLFSMLLEMSPESKGSASCPALVLFTEVDHHAELRSWEDVPRHVRKGFALLQPALSQLVEEYSGEPDLGPPVCNVWRDKRPGVPSLPYTVKSLPSDVDIFNREAREELIERFLKLSTQARQRAK